MNHGNIAVLVHRRGYHYDPLSLSFRIHADAHIQQQRNVTDDDGWIIDRTFVAGPSTQITTGHQVGSTASIPSCQILLTSPRRGSPAPQFAPRKGLTIGRFGNPSPRFQSAFPCLLPKSSLKGPHGEDPGYISHSCPCRCYLVSSPSPHVKSSPSRSPVCSSITSPVRFLVKIVAIAGCYVPLFFSPDKSFVGSA